MSSPDLQFSRTKVTLLATAAVAAGLALLAFVGRAAQAGASQAKAVPPPASVLPATRSTGGPRDQFVEVAEKSGIHFSLTSGGPEKRYIIEAKGGGGIAWIDYDNDGFPDLFLVNGSTFEQWKQGASPRSRLYHNNGDGTFTDVSARSGLDHTGWGMGVCVADYDNDGFDDLYVTYYGGNVLYHNNGNGTFTDVTEKAGVRGGGWGMGCGFGDYDNDGHLDLYVADYLDVDILKLGEHGQRAQLHLPWNLDLLRPARPARGARLPLPQQW